MSEFKAPSATVSAASNAPVELLVLRGRQSRQPSHWKNRRVALPFNRRTRSTQYAALNTQLEIAVNLLESVTPKVEIESWAIKSPLKMIPARYVDARKGHRRTISGCQSYMFA